MDWVVFQWPSVWFGIGVLLSRALFGDEDVRARTRVMTWVVIATVISYGLWLHGPPNAIVTAAVFASLIAIPLAAIHGILRYGAFDIAPVTVGAWRPFVQSPDHCPVRDRRRQHPPCCSQTA